MVNYCKTTISEMDVLALTPDKHCLDTALHIKQGVDALAPGYAKLSSDPASDADAARKTERRVEKA